MKALLRLGLRVGLPFVGQDLNVTEGRPPEVLPWPPPWGWSTGFIATPRTVGRQPSHRVRPAFLKFLPKVWEGAIAPRVAWAETSIRRFAPEGSRIVAYLEDSYGFV